MSKINPARMTHHHDGELVVFLIGMTINKPWRPDKWIPTFLAMPKMLRELSQDSESGLLGYRLAFEGKNPTVIQYWSSLEKLYAYATDSQALHRPAWTAFNRRARNAPGAVGIWHETYQVKAAESIYKGTPPMGLARATQHVPVTLNTARQRIDNAVNSSAAR